MALRADHYTQTRKTPDLFSDFLVDLTPHPISGDVARASGANAVKQALRNLVMTNLGERVFQPQIGSNVRKALFEINDQAAADDLQYFIRQTIEQNEPRVQLLSVECDSQPDKDRVVCNIVFMLINSQQIQQLDLILRRVR